MTLGCGGNAIITTSETIDEAKLAKDKASGAMTGERYCDEVSTHEMPATKADEGSLPDNARAMSVKEAIAFSSSD